jgi:hypothetical protein
MVSYNGVRVFGSIPGGKEGLAESGAVWEPLFCEGDGAEVDEDGFASDVFA